MNRTESRRVSAIVMGFVFLLLFLGCATSSGGNTSSGPASHTDGYPDWYLNPQSVYPDDTYMTAIGTGDTRRDAEQQAMSGLSQTFEAQVSVDSRTSERYRELMSAQGTMSETEIRLAENSSVTSNQTLLNVQFGEAAVDETGRVHVIAYLERLPTARIYRDLISRNGRQVEQFLMESEGSQDMIRRYAYMSAAGVIADNNEVLLDQLGIIAPGMSQTVQLPYVYDAVLQKRADLASQMRARVSVAGDEEGRVTSILRQALSEERFPIVDDDPVLMVTGTIRIEPIASNADFESVRWTLELSMTSSDGRSLVSYDEENRSSGITEEAARAFAYRDIEEAVAGQFIGSLRSYFDGLVLGN